MENSTTDGHVCPAPYDAGIGEKVGRTLSLALLMAVTLVGNSLVIWVFKRNPALRTNMNYFMINMVASDLLYPFVLLPREMVYIWFGYPRILVGGRLGQFLCKFLQPALGMSTAVSVQSLVFIALERYIAVVYPWKSRAIFNSKRRAILISASWILAALIHAPYVFILKLETRCNALYCVKDWAPFDKDTANPIYNQILCALLIHIPLFVVSILYTVLAMKLKKLKVPGVRANTRQDVRRREQNERITKMSACIVIAFAICWLPYAVYFAIDRPGIPHRLVLVFVVLHLAWASSAISPWILFLFCENFRRALRDECCICPMTSRASVSPERDLEFQTGDCGPEAPKERASVTWLLHACNESVPILAKTPARVFHGSSFGMKSCLTFVRYWSWSRFSSTRSPGARALDEVSIWTPCTCSVWFNEFAVSGGKLPQRTEARVACEVHPSTALCYGDQTTFADRRVKSSRFSWRRVT